MTEDWRHGGFGLYVHWPFCESKCPYCDFNSHVVPKVDQTRWAKALASEIERWAKKTQGRVLGSIFFGGGTPSLMQPETVDAILRASKMAWGWTNDIEISLEANPRSVEAGRFRAYSEAGVNRVSLGVQALNETDLRRLGRTHSVKEARDAFDTARNTFDRVSFDLIYARQNQTLDAWKAELNEAVSMAVDHLSLYQLTLEPGTMFWERSLKGGLKGLPEEDLGADLYDATQLICDAAGFSAYEVSNHAKSGSESRHNSLYWRGGDYVGIGPGAHGRVTLSGTRHETEAWSNPAKWLSAAENGSADKTVSPLSNKDSAVELVMMGLRLTEGIDMNRITAWDSGVFASSKFEELQDLGLIWIDGSHLGATRHGRLILNTVISELVLQ